MCVFVCFFCFVFFFSGKGCHGNQPQEYLQEVARKPPYLPRLPVALLLVPSNVYLSGLLAHAQESAIVRPARGDYLGPCICAGR